MEIARQATSPAPARQVGVRFCSTCLAVYRQEFQRCPLDGGAIVVRATDPWVGAALGDHYVIDGFVGEGAMGRVYRAHHRDIPDRRYAIKILIGDLASTAQMRQRFQREAEHASKLAHPNVVNVIDYGTTDHHLSYIVMDLVEGPSLGSICQKGPMAPERVIRIARQLCDGLEHAHSRGMIHRDFKPDNILVVGEGDLEVARIADFGLALSKGTQARLTTTGIVCTPAYAAPEQLRGEQIDQRVDLYALGTTMFEMLSGGILPFNHSDVDTSVRTKLAGDAPSVHMVAPNVPPALVSIVGRLLASEPAKRPRSARAVARALDAAIAAPRAAMRTEETARLRVKPLGTPPPPVVDASDSNKLPNKAGPITTRITIPKRRTPPLGRALVQLLVTGLTVGGIAAYLQTRPDLRAQLVAPVAIPAVAQPPAPVVAAASPPAPAVRVASPPVAQYTPVRASAPVGESGPVREYTIAQPEKPRASASPVTPLMRRYAAVGRSLRQLDRALGRENTDDLWSLYRSINLRQAGDAGDELTEIEEAILERSPE
jgi:serine/threonine-protein kinase